MSANELDAWLAAVVDSSDDAIVTKTLDGVIRSWNRGAERLFGYTAGEAVGQQIFVIIPPDRVAEEQDVLARLRRGEHSDHCGRTGRTRGGRRPPPPVTFSQGRDEGAQAAGARRAARD